MPTARRPTPLVAGLASAIPILAALACSSSGAGGSAVRDSSGIRIVESRAPRWSDSTRWRVSDSPAVSIGAAEGAPEYQLTRVQGPLRLSDGRIVVLDGGTSEIRFYDSTGRFVAKAGGRGKGPGEFSSFAGIRRLPGDSLLVADNDRLQVLSPTGAFVRVGLRHTPDVQWAAPSVVMADGSFLSLRTLPFKARSAWNALGHWTDSATVDWVAADGSRATTLVRLAGAPHHRSALSPIGGPDAFGRRPLLEGVADRIYVAPDNRYEIREFVRGGSSASSSPEWKAAALATIIRRRVEPTPVTAALRDEYARRLLSPIGANGRPVPERTLQLFKQALDEMAYAPVLPAFSRIRVDEAGNLWVRAYDLEEDMPPPQHPNPSAGWDVFDSTGVWLGTVTMPPRFAVRTIGDDYLLGVWKDENDVEYVRMYRLTKP